MSKINLGQETAQAIVNQEPKEAIVNMPTVKDVENIAEKAVGGGSISNGIKMQVGVIPESLLEANDHREPTNEELLWLEENYNCIAFKNETNILHNQHFEKSSYGIDVCANLRRNMQEDGTFQTMYEWNIFYSKSGNYIQITIVDYDIS